MREKTIEKWLREGCDRLGLLAMKFTSPGNDGVPDRLVICPDGRVLFVELKTDTGRLSPIQAWQHKRMRKVGAKVITVYGTVGVSDLLEDLGMVYSDTPRFQRWREEYGIDRSAFQFKDVYGKQDGRDRYAIPTT